MSFRLYASSQLIIYKLSFLLEKVYSQKMCKRLAFSLEFDKIVRKVRLYCLLSIYKIYFIGGFYSNGKRKIRS